MKKKVGYAGVRVQLGRLDSFALQLQTFILIRGVFHLAFLAFDMAKFEEATTR